MKSSLFYEILSTFGGHFGLFCGMSLYGIIDVVILLYSLCCQICKKIFFPLQTIQEKDEQNYNEKIECMAGAIEVSKSDVWNNFTW